MRELIRFYIRLHLWLFVVSSFVFLACVLGGCSPAPMNDVVVALVHVQQGR